MMYVQKLAVVEAVQVTAEMLEEHKDDPGYKQAAVGDYFVTLWPGATPVLLGKFSFESHYEPLSESVERYDAADARLSALEKQVERLSAPQPPQVDMATAQRIAALEKQLLELPYARQLAALEAKLSEAPPEPKAERSEKAKRA